MNKLFLKLVLVVLPLVLTACMGSRYQITTHTGEIYIASENPQYDVKADTYMFRDENGKEILLRKQEIQYIKKQ